MSVHAFLSQVDYWLAQPPLVPDPPPAAPPGKLATASNTILGWMKWGGLVCAVGALVAAGIMMAIGRRNRNNMAIEAAVGIPWTILGLAVVLGAASLVGFFL